MALKQVLKRAVKSILPDAALDAISDLRRLDRKYCAMPTQDVFSDIYDNGVWGQSGDPAQPFYSGAGSHDETVVKTYVQAVGGFLTSLGGKPDVVDIGCGDFNVGSQIRCYCGRYTACDVVPKLIAFNRAKFAGLDVDFRVVDLTRDEIPDGDVLFIRQVLQHLSNAQIINALPGIVTACRYLILSEHLPLAKFTPNRDKPCGAETRLNKRSGVVLTSPPLNMTCLSERELCRVSSEANDIVTTLYQFH